MVTIWRLILWYNKKLHLIDFMFDDKTLQWIWGQNFWEFQKFPILVNFFSDIVKARYHENSFFLFFFKFKSPIT